VPDRRKHRGAHPDDRRLFDPAKLPSLRAAVAEHSWLLSRGYATDSALKLVGDRHDLTARQRLAVMRSSCPDQSLQCRLQRRSSLSAAPVQPLGIDGYNLLITVESALSGGGILVGRDGCCRDLASVHGTYRKVAETVPAFEVILAHLDEFDLPRIDWYLDRPVSNSGRLKALLADVLERRGSPGPRRQQWNIELVDSPDAVLRRYAGVIVTTDSAVLDQAGAWVNLAAEIIQARVPEAWVVDLRIEP